MDVKLNKNFFFYLFLFKSVISDGGLDVLVPGSSLGNQSANAFGIEINVNDKAILETSTKSEDKNKLWMDFDDFFVCFK